MRIRLLLFVAIVATSAFAGEELAAVKGRILVEPDSPLPGVTVTITSDTVVRRCVTDAAGAYLFEALPPGRYDMKADLAGFRTAGQIVNAAGGVTNAPSLQMSLTEVAETITVACGVPCAPNPKTKWNYPDCDEYAFNDVLIRALDGGDRSAGELLAQRYATTFTIPERHRITAALSHNGQKIAGQWEELAADAANAVRLRSVPGGDDSKLIAYCREHGCEPETYYYETAMRAFEVACDDPRARPFLLEAIETDDRSLVYTAITGFAAQHDKSVLPAIEKALRRLAEIDPSLPWALFDYGTEDADQLALRYLDEANREAYVRDRRELNAAPPAAAHP